MKCIQQNRTLLCPPWYKSEQWLLSEEMMKRLVCDEIEIDVDQREDSFPIVNL